MASQQNMDLVVLIEPIEDVKNGFTKRLIDNHREIKQLTEAQRPAPGRVAYLTNKSVMVEDDSSEAEQKSESLIFLVGMDENMKKQATEATYEALKRLRMVAMAQGRSQLAFVLLTDGKTLPLREMLECILYGGPIKATIYQAKEQRKVASENVEPTREANWQRGKRKKKIYKSTVIVDVGAETQQSYADTLKHLKKEIDIDEIGIQIRAVGKTKKGNIRINLAGEKEDGAAILKSAIEQKVKHQVNVMLPRKSIIITDMDEETTQDELKDTIMVLTGQQETDIDIQPLRKNRRDKLAATVALPKDSALNLIGKGKIRIGWASCRVLEKVRPTRCYRCQGFGHFSSQCKSKEVNMTGKCLKCGEGGHIAQDCTNEAHCYECKEKGHRAGSVACPKYKELVQKMKRKTGAPQAIPRA